MRGVFIILDGVADLPTSALNNQTPLEAAKTPNLDEIAKKSKLDYCFPVKEGIAPQSHTAVLSLLGYDSSTIPRGPLEAQGAGIKIRKGDLVLRTNFCTIDSIKDGNILDKRAGRIFTKKETKILARAINENVKLPYPFEFHSTVQHRGILIFRGGFSDNITNADPFYGKGVAYQKEEAKIQFSRPMDDEDDSKLSADLVNAFMRKSHEVLNNHPINIARAKKGLFAANFLNCREPGNSPIKLKKIKGPDRPVHMQKDRAKILSALEVVDYVVMLPYMPTEQSYNKLVKKIKPNIIALTRGYEDSYHKRVAKITGARLRYVTKMVGDHSTSRILNRR